MTHIDFITLMLTSAASIASDYFGKTTASKKEDQSIVTEADVAIGNMVIEGIKKYFPSYNSIDEEKGSIDNSSDYTWVIDPIDGTSNFAAASPLYGCMMGLLYKDQPIAGGIMLPYFNQLLIAEKGKGAFCNREKVSVTKEKDLRNVLVSYGLDHHKNDPDFTKREIPLVSQIIRSVRNLRSSNSAFDSAQVAMGVYGATLSRSSKIWDNTAQHIIIEEAGGVYTDFFGDPIDYSHPFSKMKTNFSFCAAAPGTHKNLQAIIHERGELLS